METIGKATSTNYPKLTAIATPSFFRYILHYLLLSLICSLFSIFPSLLLSSSSHSSRHASLQRFAIFHNLLHSVYICSFAPPSPSTQASSLLPSVGFPHCSPFYLHRLSILHHTPCASIVTLAVYYFPPFFPLFLHHVMSHRLSHQSLACTGHYYSPFSPLHWLPLTALPHFLVLLIKASSPHSFREFVSSHIYPHYILLFSCSPLDCLPYLPPFQHPHLTPTTLPTIRLSTTPSRSCLPSLMSAQRTSEVISAVKNLNHFRQHLKRLPSLSHSLSSSPPSFLCSSLPPPLPASSKLSVSPFA